MLSGPPILAVSTKASPISAAVFPATADWISASVSRLQKPSVQSTSASPDSRATGCGGESGVTFCLLPERP